MKLFFKYLIVLMTGSSLYAQHNVIKANLSSIAIGNAYVSYERTLLKKFSVSLGVCWTPGRGIPFAGSFESLNGNESPMKAMNLSGFAFTPEIRLYTSLDKSAPKGFYVSPYLRFSQYSFSVKRYEYSYNDIYSENIFTKSEVDFSGKARFFGGGIMFGHQWIIAKFISIDFWILGIGITNARIDLKAFSEDMNSGHFEDGSDFADGVANYFKILNSVETDNGQNFVKANSERILPGLRGLGFNVGVAF